MLSEDFGGNIKMNKRNLNELDDIREIVYQSYVSKHFGFSHDINNIEREYYRTYLWWKDNLWRFINHLDKKSKILDVGCGLGHHIYALKKLGFKNVLGIDISEECIEFCKRRGFNVVQADAFEFLSECNEKYDLIIAFDIIEHLTVEEGYLLSKLVLDRLKNKGLFIINVPNANNPLELRDRFIDITHKVIYTPESIRELLLVAGFREVKVMGVKPFSTIDKSFSRRLIKKFVMLPVYKISLALLKIFYYSQGFFDVKILEHRILAIGYK